MAKRFLSLDRATFRLGDEIVFPNTTWNWRTTEQWAVVGPNGSGKSLFAEALTGRIPIVRGDIQFGFRAPAHLHPEHAISRVAFEDRARELHGAVIQSRWNSIEEEGALLAADYLSYERVMEISAFERSPHHRALRASFQRRLARAVNLLDLSPLLGKPLMALSNGERQRIELGKALSRPVRLLILDEPFIALDTATRSHFTRALAHLMRTAMKVLILTTRPEDLPSQTSHVLQLDHCNVVRKASRREFLAQRRAICPAGKHSKSSAHLLRSRKRHGTNCSREVLIQIRNATVRYGTKSVFEGLDWTVRAGESWALLGPNGSGKSTLLGLISGDHPQAYNNDVTVFGRRRGNGESIASLKRGIGWVSPELQLHFSPWATCLEIALSGFRDSIGLFEKPTSRQRAGARQRLKQVGLAQAADKPWHTLSPGQQRMVLLARALVKRPRLLILDEPCQGLDMAHTDEVIRLVDALVRERHTAVIYVTHRADELPGSITRTLLLK